LHERVLQAGMATPATHSVDLRRVPAAVHPGHEGPRSLYEGLPV
jgi:hypothetical protein